MKRISIIAGTVALLAAITLIGCDLFAGTLTITGPTGNIPYNGTYTYTYTNGAQQFTITNSGSNTLNLTGSPAVQVSPPATVTQPSSTSLAVNATTTFSITISTTGTFTVSIPNDSVQNPFTFTIKAN